MKKFYFIITLLVLFGGLMGYLIFPKGSDTALMNYKSANYAKAIKQYEEYIKRTGDTSPNIIVPLSKLYLETGNTNNAIKLIQKYIIKDPNSVEAKKLLSSYFKSTHKTADFIRLTEELAKMNPNENVYKLLFEIYSSRGDTDNITKSLYSLIQQKDYRINEADFRTLIYFYASKYEYKKAKNIINILLKKDHYKIQEFATFDLIVHIFIDSENMNKAYKISLKCLDEDFPLSQKLQIATAFRYSSPRRAISLLKKIGYHHRNNNLVKFAILDIKAQMGRKEEVIKELNTMASRNKLSGNLLNLYITLLIETKDNRAINLILKNYDVLKLSDENLVILSTYFLLNKLQAPAKYLADKLGQKFLYEYPLLNLLLNSIEHNNSISFVIKEILEKNYFLTNSQILLFAETLFKENDIKQSEILLSTIPIATIATEFDLEIFAQIALKSGKIDKYLKSLKLLYSQYNKNKITKIPEAYLILNIAANNNKRLTEILSELKKDKNYYLFLKTSYFASLNFRRKETALEIAYLMKNLKNTQETKLYMAEAYVINNMFTKAEGQFNTIKLTNKKSSTLYLSILTKIATLKGNHAIDKFKEKYATAIKQILKTKPTDDELRTLGYFYTAIKDKSKAIDIFFKLSKKAKYKSPDVRQLIVLSTEHKKNDVVLWITKNTNTKNMEEKAFWLRSLNRIGNSEDVLNILTLLSAEHNYKKIYLDHLLINNTQGYKEYINSISPKQFQSMNPDIELNTLYNLGQYKKFTDQIKSLNIKEYNSAPLKTKIELFSILTQTGFTQKAYSLLNNIGFNNALKYIDPFLLTEVYIKNNKINKGIALFLKVDPTQYPDTLRIEESILLLYAAKGEKNPISEWLQKKSNKNKTLIYDLFYTALDNKQAGTALLIGKTVYEKKTSQKNKKLYLEALINSKLYTKAMNLISIPKNNFETEIYLQSTAKLLKAKKKLPENYNDVLNKIYKNGVASPSNVPIDQQRTLGYIFAENGKKRKAKKIFYRLAQNKKADNPDVEQLIYLFGRNTNKKEKKWLVKRAETAKGMQLVKWCQYLNQTGNPESTIRIIEEKVFEKKN
jgi:hypothetical protein